MQGGGIHSLLDPPAFGSPSPRRLLKERGPLRSRCLTAARPSALLPKPPTQWKLNPNFSLDPLAHLSKAARTGAAQGAVAMTRDL